MKPLVLNFTKEQKCKTAFKSVKNFKMPNDNSHLLFTFMNFDLEFLLVAFVSGFVFYCGAIGL